MNTYKIEIILITEVFGKRLLWLLSLFQGNPNKIPLNRKGWGSDTSKSNNFDSNPKKNMPSKSNTGRPLKNTVRKYEFYQKLHGFLASDHNLFKSVGLELF